MIRLSRSTVLGVGLTLGTIIGVWLGTRFYLKSQINSIFVDLRQLDASGDRAAFAKLLKEKYAGHFVGRRCEADYCADRFLFANRALSIFHLAPESEIRVVFEQAGNALRDVSIEYTSAVFKENSPIVYVSEGFCAPRYSPDCAIIFVMNPHGRDVGQTWNGDVGFSQWVDPALKQAAWELSSDCFVALRGCRSISEFAPKLWKMTTSGLNSCVRSDSDSIAEAAQPLIDCAR